MDQKNNIIITGGQLYNKGAQSMTFNVINTLKSIYPDKKIYLMSMDYDREVDDKEIYNFEFLPHRTKVYLNIGHFNDVFKKGNLDKETNMVRTVLKDAFLNIDISGLKFTSQMTTRSNWDYLLQRKTMEKYNIAQYIFPQSFGPFDYKFFEGLLLKQYAGRRMKKAKCIMCREKQGHTNIKSISDKNLVQTFDSVFYGNEYHSENIFKKEIKIKEFDIENNAVGIIPNEKVKLFNKNNDLKEVYRSMIEQLLDRNKKVYIFRHSTEDLDFCRTIKKMYENNNNVVLIEDDLNCIELKKLISKFNFIIGSRYHSIVHAYSNNVPAIILGWAYKYHELANSFNQDAYMFDIRENQSRNDINDSLSKMVKNYPLESKKISSKLNEIREKDIFDVFRG